MMDNGKTLRVTNDNGAFTPEEILALNRAHDAKFDRETRTRRGIPEYFIPVPDGFDKTLDNDALNALVWPTIIARREAELEAWRFGVLLAPVEEGKAIL
jgi:hypothetical protein